MGEGSGCCLGNLFYSFSATIRRGKEQVAPEDTKICYRAQTEPGQLWVGTESAKTHTLDRQ